MNIIWGLIIAAVGALFLTCGRTVPTNSSEAINWTILDELAPRP